MYHAIVKRIAARNFTRVNEKNYDALLKDCAPDVYHRFGGSHALGGERHDREALRRWFDRLGRVSPNLLLTVHDIWAKGTPATRRSSSAGRRPRTCRTARRTTTMAYTSCR